MHNNIVTCAVKILSMKSFPMPYMKNNNSLLKIFYFSFLKSYKPPGQLFMMWKFPFKIKINNWKIKKSDTESPD